MYDNCIFFIFLIISFRYPFDEAATIAISTVKESSNDFKEVFLYCFLLLLFLFYLFIYLLWTPLFQYLHLFYVAKLFGSYKCAISCELAFTWCIVVCRCTLFYSLQIFTMCGWTRQTKCWKISLFYQLAMERIMGTCLSYLYVQPFYFEVDGGLCMDYHI